MAVTSKKLFLASRWEQVILITSFLIVMEVTGILQPTQTFIYQNFLSPSKSWWIQRTTQLNKGFSSFKKIFNSASHIQDLESRLAESTAALTELESLKKENQELRFLLENTDRPQTRTALSRPVVSLAKPAVSGGKNINLEKGSLVLSRETLLGQLSKIGPHESQVVLLHEKESIPILSKTESGVEGIIKGDDKKIIFTEVAKTDQLVVGEKIYTMGQNQVEQGILIGQISFINYEVSDSVQTAVVEQYVSFFETPVVEIR
jgi:rod shape-determining protein MreC